MIKIEVTGIKELQAQFKDFSQRRMNAALATGLTRAAKRVSQDWQAQVNSKIDKPVARTRSASMFKGASANTLTAEVKLKDQMVGLAPATYLAPQERGGDRLLKKFERSLVASGAMPRGYITVPGKHAQRDSYGNVSRSLIIAVISQLGKDFSPGYQQVISKRSDKRLASQAKRGRRYIVVKPSASRVSPGIYERMANGSLKAVFLFHKDVNYSKRLSLIERSQQVGNAIAVEEIGRALAESLARMQQTQRGRA